VNASSKNGGCHLALCSYLGAIDEIDGCFVPNPFPCHHLDDGAMSVATMNPQLSNRNRLPRPCVHHHVSVSDGGDDLASYLAHCYASYL